MPEHPNPTMNYGKTGYNWHRSKIYYPILVHKKLQDRMIAWIADPQNIPGYYGLPQNTYYLWFQDPEDVVRYETYWAKGGKFFVPEGQSVRLINDRNDANTVECMKWLTDNGYEFYLDVPDRKYQFTYIYDPDAAMYAKLRWHV